MHFNRVGIIDTYSETKIDHYYQKHSELIVTANASPEITSLLLNNEEDRILVKSTNLSEGFYIETANYVDDSQVEIIIYAKSLSVMMSWRTVEGQQRFSGNVEDVLKGFVDQNAIHPPNPNRVIPGLVLGVNEGIPITTEESYVDKQLDIALWEICTKFDMSFQILMNHIEKIYVFHTFVGADRSAEQRINPHVIFSKAFDNVTSQSFVDDKANYRSMAYVVGAEGVVVRVNNESSGFARRELYVDMLNLEKKYQDDKGKEIILTEVEFEALLKENGLSRLSEYQYIRTFESEIDSNSQFEFNKDYFLGDRVTNRNDELGIVQHSRVTGAKELYNRDGYTLQHEFGKSIPTLLDKIKREVK